MKYKTLTGFVYTALIFTSISCSNKNDDNTNKPNVLFIAVDDLRPELNCYGKSHMVTPNYDRIAEQGVVFTNHHVQMAVCIPSRVALMTSLRPETTRQLFGQLIYRKTTPGAITMAEHFQDHGYYTAYRGKIIHGEYPEGRIRYGLDEEVYAPDWTDSYVELENRYLWDYGPKDKRPLAESSDKPDSLFLDGIIMKRALKTMENCASADKPFFLAVGLHKPHTPFSAPKRFWDMYKREEIDLAENNFFPENMPLQAFNGWADMGRFRETPDPQEMHLAVKNNTPFPEMSPDSARLLKHAYYACVSWTDYNIGRLLDKLKELGLDKNTIVVVWGDHGYHLGEHQMWSKSTNFDIATKSPLIVSVPGMKHKNIKQDELVESVDLFPTLTELCGIPSPALTEGCSFVPLLKDPDRKWKKAAFSMYFRGREPNRTIGFSIRTNDYRYTEWVTGWTEYHPTKQSDYKVVARELYKYSTDPNENNNVAEAPENAELLKQLSKKLYEGYKEAGPEGWTPKPFPENWESKVWNPGWKNTGFETGGVNGWAPVSNKFNASISFVEYHTGGHSLLVSDRKKIEHTVAQEVKLSSGNNYKCTIWVKCREGTSVANLNLRLDLNNSTVLKTLDRKEINDQNWTKLQGTFKLDHNYEEAEKSIEVLVDQLNDFYIDDFSIEQLDSTIEL